VRPACTLNTSPTGFTNIYPCEFIRDELMHDQKHVNVHLFLFFFVFCLGTHILLLVNADLLNKYLLTLWECAAKPGLPSVE